MRARKSGWFIHASGPYTCLEPSKLARVLDAGDLLESPSLLPGFSVPVSKSVYPPPPPPPPPPRPSILEVARPHPYHRRRLGRIGSGLPSRAPGAARRPLRDAADPPDARSPDGPAGGIGLQQLTQDRSGGRRSLAAEARVAPARFPVIAGGRNRARAWRACAHRRPRPVRRRGDARRRQRAADRIEARRSAQSIPADRIAFIVATGPLTSDSCPGYGAIAQITGSGPPVLLRQHQPHRRGRQHRPEHRVPRIPLWQIARRDRRLPELPVRPEARYGALPRRADRRPERSGPHRRGPARATSKPAFRSRSWPGAAARHYGSVR